MKHQQVIRRLFAVSALAVAAVLVAACGEGEASPNNSTPPPSSGPQEVRVAMHDNYFEPTEITVRAGSPVTFIGENVGIAMHNMIIKSEAAEGQDYMSAILVNPGEESVFEATFSQPGTYEFHCSLHLPGMVGTLTVE